MRLLRTNKLEVVEFQGQDIPHYAILSHTWAEEEVSLQDVQQGLAQSRRGYKKVAGACAVAVGDGFEYIWIDTCCIDKTSSAELSEAINSMFRWYGEAEVCYAFLSDVDAESDPRTPSSSFRMSRWFTRGWTLQELIAPAVVYFYGAGWKPIGSREKLLDVIVQITRINPAYFTTGDLSQFCAAQKMSWAANRNTTRPEDEAYCLLGLFDINMPLLYGEGKRAFQRLQEEILRQSEDDSLFAHRQGQLLAASPRYFRDCSRMVKRDTWPYISDLTFELNRNLSINRDRINMAFPIANVSKSDYHKAYTASGSGRLPKAPQGAELGGLHFALLNCGTSEWTSLLLLREQSPGVFVKLSLSNLAEQAILEPEFMHKLLGTRVSISRAATTSPTGLWDWRARNDHSTAREALRDQMRLVFEVSWCQYAKMTPIVRPALPYDGPAGGLAVAGSSQNVALDKLRDKVVVKVPCPSTSGFRLQYVYVADFRFTWLERGDEIHLIPYEAGVKGKPCFVFSSQTGESFMVTVQPTRVSVNAQLYTNIPAWKGKQTVEYIEMLARERRNPWKSKLLRYRAPQRVDGKMEVTVQLHSRRQMNGWWVYVSVTPMLGDSGPQYSLELK